MKRYRHREELRGRRTKWISRILCGFLALFIVLVGILTIFL